MYLLHVSANDINYFEVILQSEGLIKGNLTNQQKEKCGENRVRSSLWVQKSLKQRHSLHNLAFVFLVNWWWGW